MVYLAWLDSSGQDEFNRAIFITKEVCRCCRCGKVVAGVFSFLFFLVKITILTLILAFFFFFSFQPSDKKRVDCRFSEHKGILMTFCLTTMEFIETCIINLIVKG